MRTRRGGPKRLGKRVLSGIVVGVFFLIGGTLALPTGPFPDGAGALQADIQATVEQMAAAYAAAVSDIVGVSIRPPAVVAANTPNLAYYDRRAQRIVIPYWPPQDSTVSFLLALTDGDGLLASELFAGLFDWFLVAHELTHWLQDLWGFSGDHFTSEALANGGAVAFHRLTPEGEGRLVRLDELLAGALERLTDPTPARLDPVTYFNAFYPSLSSDPRRYGYYQFRLIRDAIARRDGLDFAEFVASLAVPPESSGAP